MNSLFDSLQKEFERLFVSNTNSDSTSQSTKSDYPVDDEQTKSKECIKPQKVSNNKDLKHQIGNSANTKCPSEKENLKQKQNQTKKKKMTKPTHFKSCIFMNSRSCPTISLANRGLSDSDIKSLVQWLSKSEKVKAIIDKKGIFVCNIELYENSISDLGVTTLVDFLLSNRTIRVKSLKLWKNNIGDEGAKQLARYISNCNMTLVELHLSHNRISTQGAISLLKAIEGSPLYPRPVSNKNKSSAQNKMEQNNSSISLDEDVNQDHNIDNTSYSNSLCPLWLRLEWNFINLELLNAKYDLKNLLSPCYAVDRMNCGPNGCCNALSKESSKCKVHLYVFHLQYLKPEESTLLTEAKSKIQNIVREENLSTPSVTKASSELEAISEKFASKLPTYIFIDTCAILSMIDAPRHIQVKPSEHRFCQSFNFRKLIEMARNGKFGSCFESDGDKTHLIITDTIMQELDHRKSKESREWLKEAIRRQLQSEKGYMESCSRLKFMTCLGAHQGELLLKASNIHFFENCHSQQSSTNLYNDMKLIEIAMFWSRELGFNKNVIVLTSDYEVKRRAKSHNIPAELLKNIDRSLTNFSQNNPDSPWTANVIKSCMSSAFADLDTSSISPISSSATSIFNEIESAINLVEKLTKSLEDGSKETKNEEDSLINEAKEAINRWKNILNSSRDWLKAK
jgi:rRNA-processing protein FCF1